MGGQLNRRHIAIFQLCLLIIVFCLASCQLSPGQTLPTLVPTLALEQPSKTPTPRETRGALPATYTPAPSKIFRAGLLPARASSVQTVESIPSPVPLAALLQIAGKYPQPVDVIYMDSPPAQVDCQSGGLVFKSRFPSNVDGPWRNYHAYLPPCYGIDSRVYPVLFLLHGSIQNDSHWLELGLAEYLDAGISSGRFPPFVVIMPDSGQIGNYTSGGWKSVEGVTVNSLVPFIESNYCVWRSPSGRGISGISRGGYWALEIAFMHPDLFGAVAGHSSHLRLETDPAKYNPLSTYATVDLSRMRIRLDWGENDFLRAGQVELHRLLGSAGIAHEVQVNPGGHSDVYWAEHLAEYIDWHSAVWPRERQDYEMCEIQLDV